MISASRALEKSRVVDEVSAFVLAREHTLDWILRVGCAMCFVGHGAFGILQKPAWTAYFAVVGLGRDAAFDWMPVIGAWDILMGVLVLTYPRPAIALWMTGWAVWTALLRPLAGESVWETLERAGNFGVPLVLLRRMAPPRSWQDWFSAARFGDPSPDRVSRISVLLRVTVVLLLVGHGVLSIGGKTAYLHNLASVLGDRASAVLPLFGWIEIGLAAAVALHPSTPLLVLIALWKLAIELLWMTGGAPWWEWIERGGSYAAPIALAIALRSSSVKE